MIEFISVLRCGGLKQNLPYLLGMLVYSLVCVCIFVVVVVLNGGRSPRRQKTQAHQR